MRRYGYKVFNFNNSYSFNIGELLYKEWIEGKGRYYEKNGFTLIELMVVISIAGILAAIGLPRYTSISKDAKVAQIRRNKKNLETALQIYVSREDKSIDSLWVMEGGGIDFKGDLNYFERNYLMKDIPPLPQTASDGAIKLVGYDDDPDLSDEEIAEARNQGFGWAIDDSGTVYPLVLEGEYGLEYDEF